MNNLFNKIHDGNCLDIMYDIWDESIDLIICDPPYGKTGLDWDEVIDPSYFFWHLKRIIKPTGIILLFGREPFISKMRVEAEDIYKYDWIWKKSRKNGYVHACSGPLQDAESIAVFSKGMRIKTSKNIMVYNSQEVDSCATTILEYDNVPLSQQFHPCQKPVDLGEYLIKAHSNKNNIILDPCCGSGTFCLAAKNTGRVFIGIDKEKEYVDISNLRLKHGVLYTNKRTKPCGKHKTSTKK